MATLLEKAKKVQVTKKGPGNGMALNREVEDVLLAYLRGEISRMQAAAVLNISGTSMPTVLGSLFMNLYRGGRVTIKPRLSK